MLAPTGFFLSHHIRLFIAEPQSGAELQIVRVGGILFQIDLGRENSVSYYRQGRQLLLTLLTMVTRLSCSTSNFYALIGQNLTGEFMRKIYAAS